jgi:hypothetical protein
MIWRDDSWSKLTLIEPSPINQEEAKNCDKLEVEEKKRLRILKNPKIFEHH